MENKVNQRVIEFLKFKNISKNHFCDMVNVSYTTFNCAILQDRNLNYLKYFNEVREKLGWKNSYTLYSFRDTGITDLLKSGVPAIDVMKLADHSSLDVTSIYIKHIDNSLCKRISKIAPNF